MIQCAVCGKRYKMITNTHLVKHGLTPQDYRHTYGLPITSQETRDKHKRKLKRKKVDPIDWDHASLGQKPDFEIAVRFGVSYSKVNRERNKRGISPFKGYLLTQEGYHCRSVYEAMYDACLHASNCKHEHEVPIPNTSRVADFRVDGCFIEIAGMLGFAKYTKKHLAKRQELERFGVNVAWLTREQVSARFKKCPVSLRVVASRVCEMCNKHTYDLVKGVCRKCYMKQWHAEHGTPKVCEWCGESFVSTNEKAKFCSHAHYAKSLELDWPSWEWIDEQCEKRPVRQVAFDMGVKPGTLAMRLHRRKKRSLLPDLARKDIR